MLNACTMNAFKCINYIYNTSLLQMVSFSATLGQLSFSLLTVLKKTQTTRLIELPPGVANPPNHLETSMQSQPPCSHFSLTGNEFIDGDFNH